MNGIHDMGGMEGFGPIAPEPDEPVFHEAWERRVLGLTLAAVAQGFCSVDEFRHAVERMDPVEYLASPYYAHWLHAAEELLVEKGMITRDELEARRAELAEASS